MAEAFAPFVRNGVALGENIFVFNHIRTNQVIYSLTRIPITKKVLPQLTFIGKKSVPPVIRKDVWLPLARIYFPRPSQGLKAFHRLREFRKRHEFEWRQKGSRDQRLGGSASADKRRHILMDQKANSIADIAATLQIQASMAKAREPPKRPALAKVKKRAKAQWPRISSMNGVSVSWRNIEDASYARAWPQEIKHYHFQPNVRTGPMPAASDLVKPSFADDKVLGPKITPSKPPSQTTVRRERSKPKIKSKKQAAV